MTKAYWHIHHDVLVEFATEPIRNRIKYIKKHKPAGEVKTRLRLLKPVKGKLPEAVVKAGKAYVDAAKVHKKASDLNAPDRFWDVYIEACEGYDLAREAYYQALIDNMPAVLELHTKECPNCPWDGETIFPERRMTPWGKV